MHVLDWGIRHRTRTDRLLRDRSPARHYLLCEGQRAAYCQPALSILCVSIPAGADLTANLLRRAVLGKLDWGVNYALDVTVQRRPWLHSDPMRCWGLRMGRGVRTDGEVSAVEEESSSSACDTHPSIHPSSRWHKCLMPHTFYKLPKSGLRDFPTLIFMFRQDRPKQWKQLTDYSTPYSTVPHRIAYLSTVVVVGAPGPDTFRPHRPPNHGGQKRSDVARNPHALMQSCARETHGQSDIPGHIRT